MHSHHQNLAGNLAGAGRLQAKIDTPKAFAGAKLDGTEVDSWIFLMNLHLAVLNVAEHQHSMRAALNLSQKATVWLHL